MPAPPAPFCLSPVGDEPSRARAARFLAPIHPPHRGALPARRARDRAKIGSCRPAWQRGRRPSAARSRRRPWITAPLPAFLCGHASADRRSRHRRSRPPLLRCSREAAAAAAEPCVVPSVQPRRAAGGGNGGEAGFYAPVGRRGWAPPVAGTAVRHTPTPVCGRSLPGGLGSTLVTVKAGDAATAAAPARSSPPARSRSLPCSRSQQGFKLPRVRPRLRTPLRPEPR